ncbi:MAG: hypothetical protein AMXMBFR84_40190 [Candidatus Hydrogenedentota bacterium]
MGSSLLKCVLRKGGAAVCVALCAHAFAGQTVNTKCNVQFDREWGSKGDQSGQFNFPIGIAINSAGEILVTDYYNDRIQTFAADGTYQSEFKTLPNPGALTLDPEGMVYVTHFAASIREKDKAGSGDFVSVYSPGGDLKFQFGSRGKGDGEFDCPGGIAIGNDGRIYIADQTNHRIQVFDKTGAFLFKWGRHGSAPGEFGGAGAANSRTSGPQFVAVDNTGNVWTTEGSNGRIQKFSCNGQFLAAWGDNEDTPGHFGGVFTGFGDDVKTTLQGPVALAFDNQQRLWVTAVSGRIQCFSQEGDYLGGIIEKQGTGPSQFIAPHMLAFDPSGRLYVVDAFNHRIQSFQITY